MRAIRTTILFHGIHAVAGLQSGRPPLALPTESRDQRRPLWPPPHPSAFAQASPEGTSAPISRSGLTPSGYNQVDWVSDATNFKRLTRSPSSSPHQDLQSAGSGFKCRVFHAFTTAGGVDVVYELSLRGRNLKLYYSVNKGDTDLTRKILVTESLKRSGMPDDLPKSQPSDCKATMREVLKYAWNYASGRFRPKEGGALNESTVQQEFSWQLELDSNDKWISFGGKNSYVMPSSLGSDVLTKFAKKAFPEKGEPLKLPDMPETLWYLEMEGKDLSMALNRDFTIHRISLPGMSTPWEGMLAAIGHLSQLKKTFYKDKPRRSKDISRVAFGNYLESICLKGTRSSEGTFNGETMTVWPFGEEIYDKCSRSSIPLSITRKIFEPGALNEEEEFTFIVPEGSPFAGVMEILELFARRHVGQQTEYGS
ncbi:hypothetical protein FOZ62_003585 [Perkinsus olseni]|uniref:Uncharacterized protein n=1 Tax=Perkinsus olseni TaxID=32597 RepID=A0A7J6PZK9_PEROL|nr:hypothetical protein FOZ62_003585 [Perkinsus olseni]